MFGAVFNDFLSLCKKKLKEENDVFIFVRNSAFNNLITNAQILYKLIFKKQKDEKEDFYTYCYDFCHSFFRSDRECRD